MATWIVVARKIVFRHPDSPSVPASIHSSGTNILEGRTRHRRIWRALLCGLLALTPAAIAHAQTAELSGRVQDDTKASISDAELTLTERGTDYVYRTRSNGEGFYVFVGLRPGTYGLRVTARDLAVKEIANLRLEVEQKASLNVQLAVRAFDETVSVQADALSLGTRDGSVSTVIDRRAAENMPLNGRTFQSLFELSPGVIATSGGYAVAGQRADANYVQVDGISANVGTTTAISLEGSGAGRTVATTVTGGYNGIAPLETLQEFRVQTSSFAPEYGRGPGAQVSIVTRSGTNRFSGSAFEQVRDDAFDANDWFANSHGLKKSDVRQQAFGGALGGPLLPKQLFFFGSYEGLRLDQPSTLIASVPSQALRDAAPASLQPLLNAYPAPTSTTGTPWMQGYAASIVAATTSDSYSLRVDHLTPRLGQMFGRYFKAPSSVDTPNLTTMVASRYSLQGATGGWTVEAGRGTFLDIRANYTRNTAAASYSDRLDIGAPPPPASFFPQSLNLATSVIGYSVNGARLLRGAALDNGQAQFNVTGSATRVVGAHHLKVGGDYRRLTPELSLRDRDVSVNFRTPDAVLNARASDVIELRYRPVDVTFQGVSLYAQDAWQVSSRTTATFGLRWDLNPAPSYAADASPLALVGYGGAPADLDFAPRGTSLWKTRYGNIAPRLGLAHTLNDTGLTLLGGAGLFYDTGQENGATIIAGNLYPNFASRFQQNIPFPIASLADLPLPSGTPVPPYGGAGVIQAVNPNLRTPRTWQWNLRVEQQIGASQSVWVGYIGAAADALSSTVPLSAPNARFPGGIVVRSDDARSRYHSLQAQYKRRSSSGLAVLASYTYSRTFDNGSAGTALLPPDASRGTSGNWGPADFDVRHNFTASISYDISRDRVPHAIGWLDGLSFDGLVRLRSGAPITVLTGDTFLSLGVNDYQRADVVPGVPLVLNDASAPGGRRLNPAAFAIPENGAQGNMARGVLRGFGASQVDFGVRRAFGLAGRARLQVRIDAYNVFNVPNFADPNPILIDPDFGVSMSMLNRQLSIGGLSPLYQWGGTRAVECSLRLTF